MAKRKQPLRFPPLFAEWIKFEFQMKVPLSSRCKEALLSCGISSINNKESPDLSFSQRLAFSFSIQFYEDEKKTEEWRKVKHYVLPSKRGVVHMLQQKMLQQVTFLESLRSGTFSTWNLKNLVKVSQVSLSPELLTRLTMRHSPSNPQTKHVKKPCFVCRVAFFIYSLFTVRRIKSSWIIISRREISARKG